MKKPIERDLGMIPVKELKKGEFFKLKESANRVYVRDDYDRSEKKYSCFAFDDVCAYRMFKGDKLVYVGFTF